VIGFTCIILKNQKNAAWRFSEVVVNKVREIVKFIVIDSKNSQELKSH
jgi:hypothetical protein